MAQPAACTCIIPSRYGSTRLPAKPLQLIGTKPLVQHVWERAREAGVFDRILVATDDARIRDVVTGFGGEAVMTSPRLASGTDRVAAVARRLRARLILNLQGDEPFIAPRGLAALVRAMRRDPACPFGTLARVTPWAEIAHNPHAVKIVTDGRGRALYFSRSPVPYDWTGRATLLQPRLAAGRRSATLLQPRLAAGRRSATLLQHIGVYCYRRAFLLRFARWPRTELEKRERLEQLRVFAYGIHPKVVVTATPALSIDTTQDLKHAREWLSQRGPRRVTGRRSISRRN